jgi:hypothetical protein
MSRFWKILLTVALVGSVAMNFVGPAKEPAHVWDVRAFFAIYGFLGCILIIYVSKFLGKNWLQQDVDYYAPFRAPEPGTDAEPGAAEPSDEGSAGEEVGRV